MHAGLSGEFDPGSGRTLAARLIHASRTGRLRPASGGRVSNTWVTCLRVGNNAAKAALIPHTLPASVAGGKRMRSGRGLRPIS